MLLSFKSTVGSISLATQKQEVYMTATLYFKSLWGRTALATGGQGIILYVNDLFQIPIGKKSPCNNCLRVLTNVSSKGFKSLWERIALTTFLMKV
jgi:hypothetical protein